MLKSGLAFLCCSECLLLSDVVLDLGFTTKAQRQTFITKAAQIGIFAEVHYLEAPAAVRRERVKKRKRE